MNFRTDPRLRKRRGRHPRVGAAGFTLVELLVVMGIIAILVVIALPRYHNARDKAFRSAMQSDLKNLASAQEAYFDTNYFYADDISLLEFNMSEGVSISIVEAVPSGWSAAANHIGTTSQCALYTGTASPVGGIPDEGEGVVSCSVN